MTPPEGEPRSDPALTGEVDRDVPEAGPEAWQALHGRHVTLMSSGGVDSSPEPDDVRRLLEEGECFWLDIHEPEDVDVPRLAEVFGLHPLVAEDLETFGQRPKVDAYGDHALVVAYGASDDEDALAEVHTIVGPTWLVTLHRDDSVAFAKLHHRLTLGGRPRDPGAALHRVLDALADSFFPLLEDWDERIDRLQDEVVDRPRDDHLRQVFALKERLITVRRVVSPQRDLMAQLAGNLVELPFAGDDVRRYLRDVYDHMIRLADMVDVERDLLTGVMEVHLAMVANRRDRVMKQLTLVATIFMPLTFVSGFFGQNFDWMVQHIGSGTAFWVATAGQLAVALGALWVFARRGWWSS